jgi:hypothetical protein
VWVPSEEELYHRQVIRRRRQLVRDRVRTQRRIKAELRFSGIQLEEPRGRWTRIYFETLRRLRFGNRWMQESFNRLLEQYEFLVRRSISRLNCCGNYLRPRGIGSGWRFCRVSPVSE